MPAACRLILTRVQINGTDELEFPIPQSAQCACTCYVDLITILECRAIATSRLEKSTPPAYPHIERPVRRVVTCNTTAEGIFRSAFIRDLFARVYVSSIISFLYNRLDFRRGNDFLKHIYSVPSSGDAASVALSCSFQTLSSRGIANDYMPSSILSSYIPNHHSTLNPECVIQDP